MNYILFDLPDTRANLLPLTFTKPVSEIRVGILTIREKWQNYFGQNFSWRTEGYLAGKFPCNLADSNIFINGSLFPSDELAERVSALKDGEALLSGARLLAARMDGEKAGSFNPGSVRQDQGSVQQGQGSVQQGQGSVQQGQGDGPGLSPAPEYTGQILSLNFPWDIFSLNGAAIREDFRRLTKGRKSAPLSSSNTVLGENEIFAEEGCKIENASLNTTAGPVYIGREAEIMEGSHLRGPFALCDHSTLKMGAKIYGPTTIGPHCKIGGEVNNSVILGYSNKAHDGFLGNSVIGEWCNLGADTNNSNLKNNYAEVRLWNYREEKFIHSGLIFCGLVMGDHSKCGINTMFNTGTVVGVNANIFGSGFPRNFIPSFSWGGAQGFSVYKIEKALEVAAEVMKRRDISLDETESDILREIFRMTEKYRS